MARSGRQGELFTKLSFAVRDEGSGWAGVRIIVNCSMPVFVTSFGSFTLHRNGNDIGTGTKTGTCCSYCSHWKQENMITFV